MLLQGSGQVDDSGHRELARAGEKVLTLGEADRRTGMRWQFWGDYSLGKTNGNGAVLHESFVCLGKNSMTIDMKKNLATISLPTPLQYQSGFSVGSRRGYNVGNQVCRESLQGLEGWALGQASEIDFQDPLEQLATGAATSATVRKVAIRSLPLKPWQEDTTVAVIKVMTIVTVAIITVEVWNVASGYGCDNFSLMPVN